MKSIYYVLIILCFSATLVAQTVDEAALFDDASQAVEVSKPTDIPVFNDVRSVGFSGRIDSFTALQGGSKALNGHLSDTSVYSLNQADLFLDVRLPNQAKAFVDLSVLSMSSSTTSNADVLADIKELFVDWNFNKKVYVRTGKQFIRWGRGYFWNPVDFLNRNHRNFLNLDALRSGITGTRIHIPGQLQNTYMFVDMNQASRLDQCALLAKYERLFGIIEIGASLWAKPHEASRMGLDWSTHILGVDVSGEYAYENQKNWNYVVKNGSFAEVKNGADRWTSSAVLNLQKQWSWKRPNRITTVYEIYYNGHGYSKEILEDSSLKAALFAHDLYDANYMSKAYHAVFISINEWPTYPTTFSTNILQNMTDQSALASIGLGYAVTDGLRINSSLLFYFGNSKTEYGMAGTKSAVILQGVLTF